MTTLELNHVAAGYGDLRVVSDATLRVESGTVTALLGRNGAGKTTTLRAVAGLNKTTGGSIELDGRSITGMAPYRRAKAGIAYVQEGKRIFRSRTVDENLQLGSYACRDATRRRALREEVLERFPMLGERRGLQASQLSGGQQQMLAIAQALVADPTVLLLDEPSAGLAPAIVGEVLSVIKDLRAQGLAVVLVEQAVDFALSVADHVVVLNLGRTTYSAAADDPDLRSRIRSAYLAEDQTPSSA